MGILVRGPALEQGETVLWKRAANRTQSNWRAVGGYLFLTASRLLFAPGWLDAVIGGKSGPHRSHPSGVWAQNHGAGTLGPEGSEPVSGST